MQKKAQAGVGIFIVLFVTLVVGLTLFIAVAQESGKATSLTTYNETFSVPWNGTAYYFDNYKNFGGTILVQNGTSDWLTIQSGNYTITNNVVNPTTGNLAVRLVPNADCPAYCTSNSTYGGAVRTWRISSSEVQKSTYISDPASRSIVGMIVVFFAIAIGFIALTPTLRNGIIDMVT